VPDDGSDAAGALVEEGLAVRKGDRLALTPRGREQADVRARLAEGSEEEATARRAYDAFLPVNATLLQVTTDWQVRPGNVPNDHADTTYDWSVIGRLEALDDQAAPVVRRLGRTVPRFAPYRDQLRAARGRVAGGEHEWFASPTCDSYHTVWMRLHEDLLLALGMERRYEAVT
jgi:hypothetical protein